MSGLAKRVSRWLTNYDDPRSLGSRLRARRAGPLKALIVQAYQRRGAVSILDIGGTERYWNLIPAEFLHAHRVRILIANLPEDCAARRFERFEHVAVDGCDLSRFADGSFDIAHSNSVIEHVGGWSRMEAFAHEIRRVAHAYYVQTPDFGCPLEPHCMTPFFHWLPARIRCWLVRHFALGHWHRARSPEEARRLVDSARLLSARQMRQLFPDARLTKERVLGLPKSLIAIRQASP